MTLMFTPALFYDSGDMEATYMSIDRGVDKVHMLHIHNRILPSHKKRNICRNTDGPRDSHK